MGKYPDGDRHFQGEMPLLVKSFAVAFKCSPGHGITTGKDRARSYQACHAVFKWRGYLS